MKPARHPNWYLVIEHEIATEYAGTTLREYYTDPDVFLQTEIAVRREFHRLYGYGSPEITEVGINPFFYTVAAILGAKLTFPEDASVQVEGRVIADLSDIGRLKVPNDVSAAGYIPDLIEKYEHLLAKSADTGIKPIFSLANQSPLGTATVLRGTKLFEDIITEPNAVKDLLETITETALKVISFQEAFTGVVPTGIGMDDDYGGLYSPELYEEFNYPYMKRMYEHRDYRDRSLHTETFGRDHLQYIPRLGVTHYDAWPYHGLTMEEVLAELPETFFTWNIATVKDLYTLTPRTIKREYSRLVEQGAPGIVMNLCARRVPTENIKAFVDVARSFD